MDSRRFRTLFSISLAIVDVALLALAFVLGHRLRLLVPWPSLATDVGPLSGYAVVLLIFLFSQVGVFFVMRMYHLVRATSRVDEFYNIFGGVTIGILLTVAVASLTLKNSVFEVNLPRAMIIYLWLASVALVTLGRWILQRLRGLMQSRGLGRSKVIVIGTGEIAQLVIQKIRGSPFLGYHVVGLVDGRDAP